MRRALRVGLRRSQRRASQVGLRHGRRGRLAMPVGMCLAAAPCGRASIGLVVDLRNKASGAFRLVACFMHFRGAACIAWHNSERKTKGVGSGFRLRAMMLRARPPKGLPNLSRCNAAKTEGENACA